MDDPFTRRSTRPRMVFKPDEEGTPPALGVVHPPVEKPLSTNSYSSNDKENGQKVVKKQIIEDLFDAHNFEISIDLEVPIPSKYPVLKLKNFNRIFIFIVTEL